MKLTSGRLRVLRGIKKFLYSQLYLRDSLLIMFGKSRPLVCFKVEDTPPSVYWNFEILPEKVDVLERELELPFRMAKLRILEGEEPRYYLTLNLYRVSGLANGIRAEWSIYIEDPENAKPRFLVVEALSDQRSIDSVDLLTRVGQVTHQLSGDSLKSLAVSERGGRFACTCRVAKKAKKADEDDIGKPVRAAAEWVEANDFIYWLSGICDRTFYDAGLANARIRQLDPSEFSIEDDSFWGRLVDPTPRHMIVFDDAIEFAMSPWWNLGDMK
jgi:hypothetical protein